MSHLREKNLVCGLLPSRFCSLHLRKLRDGGGNVFMRESFPRQVDRESRGPQGERGLEFSRKKGQTFFLSPHSLGLYNNNVSCLRTVFGLNLLLS